MLRIRLGPRKYVGDEELHDETLGRTLTGWDPTMNPDEIALAARGWWRVGERADKERYAVAVGGGIVRAVLTIDRWHTDADGRRAFDGELLAPGNRVHDRLVGRPDPVPSGSRNPVAYFDDPADMTACACGCGTMVRGDWASGHDAGALHRIIANEWGTVLAFVTWCRENDIEVPPPVAVPSTTTTIVISAQPSPDTSTAPQAGAGSSGTPT